MREILFRGKKVYDGEWVEGFYEFTYLYDTLRESHRIIWVDKASRTNFLAEVSSETVGQYTGLTDKNGKKIFEGDIVKTDKFNTPNKRYVIKYDLLLGAFIGEDDGTMYFTTFDGDSDQFEIIGNIHDNPELIKT